MPARCASITRPPLRYAPARAVIAVAALGACVVLAPPPAQAFTLLMTKGGVPKVWRKTTLRYRTVYDVAAPEPAASEGADLGARIDVAIAPWSEVTCGDDNTSVDIGFTMTEPAKVGGCPGGADPMLSCLGGEGAVRVIADVDAWPQSALTVGYTVLASDGATGENARFVLLLNDAHFDFCDTSCDGQAFDVRTVVLHEAGHVLGLDHSANLAAVMKDGRSRTELLRTLSADDKAGLCAIYPSNPPEEGSGLCSAGHAGRPLPPLALLLTALVLLWARRRAGHPAPATLRRGGLGVGLGAGLGAGVSALVALLLLPATAPAFTLAKAASGAHQRWYVDTIVYDLDDRGLGSQGPGDGATAAAIAAAYDAWMGVQCALCHDPRGLGCPPVACAAHPLGLKAHFDGWKPLRPPGLGCAAAAAGDDCTGVPDGNQFVFVATAADWPTSSHVIALTLVAADKASGAIADADVLLNAAHKRYCIAPACDPEAYDVQNSVSHEIGHQLGLDHSLTAAAAMYGGAPPGETSKRALHADDVLGVCTAYRSVALAPACPPAEEPGCCAARPPRSAAPRPAAGALLALASLVLVWARASS